MRPVVPFAFSAMLLSGLGTGPALAQNAAAGGTLFKQRCQMCHVAEKAKVPTMAPNLFGVVGRKAGSSAFANYSPALKASKIMWSQATLDGFLAAPFKVVPGTRMVMAVTDPRQRADIVAYLATLK